MIKGVVELAKGKDLAGAVMEKVTHLVAYTSVVMLALIFVFLFIEGYKILDFEDPVSMFFGTEWQPTSENPRYEMLTLILGSVVVTVGAMVIGIPLAVGCAIYLSEVAPGWLGEFLKPAIEIIAGIPSVVIGFFALVVMSPLISQVFGIPTGLTALNGAIMLAVMVIPTIETIAEDALRSVPQSHREASLALGSTEWDAIRYVVVPSAMPGIVVGILLGFGRAIGETMVVLMATGNAAVIPTSALDPVRTMTGTIAAEMGEVARGGPHFFSLFMIGCILFAISFLVNLIANSVIRREEA
ncbi:MAG: phosphate ABC transporter permease subunit PstC [Candidatus Micrarchaeota archaeon]